jgi:hypothetical protein
MLTRVNTLHGCLKISKRGISKVTEGGFGGAEVPKFAGSNPAEAVGFLKGDKNPQHAFLRKGSKIIGPMLKTPGYISQVLSGRYFRP